MDSKRLVVWISAGILVFQGGALAVDLFNCMTVTWLVVQHRGRLDPEPSFCVRPQGRIDAAVAQGLNCWRDWPSAVRRWGRAAIASEGSLTPRTRGRCLGFWGCMPP